MTKSDALLDEPNKNASMLPSSGRKRALLFLVSTMAAVITANIIIETVRFQNGKGPQSGPLDKLFTTVRINWSGDQCIQSAPAGTWSIFQPIGSCTRYSKAYEEAPTYSLLVRHGMGGPNWKIRTWIMGVHNFGALAIFYFIACLCIGRGEGGSDKLVVLAGRQLILVVFSMAVTGIVLYSFVRSKPEELGLAIPVVNWFGPWVSTYTVMFGICFITLIGHANIYQSRFLPVPAILVLNVISLACAPVFFIGMPIQMYFLPTNGYKFIFSLEALLVGSVYPVLDVLNLVALWKAHFGKKEYDWDAHRQVNFEAFVMIDITAVMVFLTNQKHYIFDQQLSLVARLTLQFLPFIIWNVTGEPIAWVLRVIALARAPTSSVEGPGNPLD